MKRYVVVALTVCFATVCLVTSGIVFAQYSRSGSPRTFDRAVWKKPVEYCTKSPRGRMADEVVSDYLKPKMAMRKARGLLGAPDEISADSTWVYNVDFEPDGLLGTCVGLQLYANGNRLERAEVTRDD